MFNINSKTQLQTLEMEYQWHAGINLKKTPKNTEVVQVVQIFILHMFSVSRYLCSLLSYCITCSKTMLQAVKQAAVETLTTQSLFFWACQVATEMFSTGSVNKTTEKGVNVKTELQILVC